MGFMPRQTALFGNVASTWEMTAVKTIHRMGLGLAAAAALALTVTVAYAQSSPPAAAPKAPTAAKTTPAPAAPKAEVKKAEAKDPKTTRGPSACVGLDQAACGTKAPTCQWRAAVKRKDGGETKAHCRINPTAAKSATKK